MDYRFCISLGIKKYTMQGGCCEEKKWGVGGGCEKKLGGGGCEKKMGRDFFLGGGGGSSVMSIILIRIDISNVKSHVKFFKREFKREEIHM